MNLIKLLESYNSTDGLKEFSVTKSRDREKLIGPHYFLKNITNKLIELQQTFQSIDLISTKLQ